MPVGRFRCPHFTVNRFCIVYPYGPNPRSDFALPRPVDRFRFFYSVLWADSALSVPLKFIFDCLHLRTDSAGYIPVNRTRSDSALSRPVERFCAAYTVCTDSAFSCIAGRFRVLSMPVFPCSLSPFIVHRFRATIPALSRPVERFRAVDRIWRVFFSAAIGESNPQQEQLYIYYIYISIYISNTCMAKGITRNPEW